MSFLVERSTFLIRFRSLIKSLRRRCRCLGVKETLFRSACRFLTILYKQIHIGTFWSCLFHQRLGFFVNFYQFKQVERSFLNLALFRPHGQSRPRIPPLCAQTQPIAFITQQALYTQSVFPPHTNSQAHRVNLAMKGYTPASSLFLQDYLDLKLSAKSHQISSEQAAQYQTP